MGAAHLFRLLSFRGRCVCARDASGSGEPPKRPHPEMDAADAAAASSSSVVPDTLPYLGSQSDWREFRWVQDDPKAVSGEAGVVTRKCCGTAGMGARTDVSDRHVARAARRAKLVSQSRGQGSASTVSA